MSLSKYLAFAVLASVSSAAWGNYVGMLKPPSSSLLPGSLYSFAAPAVLGLAPSLTPESGYRLKLGYKPSRYLALEGEYVDYSRVSAAPFGNPGSFTSSFRGTGFGLDTVATLPVWRNFSLYGRMGAYRGEARPVFAPYSHNLLLEPARGTRMRYGLGLQYDFTKALGVRAELERHAPLGHPLTAEPEADQFSVGLMWRF